jgi:hypothetical protein
MVMHRYRTPMDDVPALAWIVIAILLIIALGIYIVRSLGSR